MRFAVQGGRIDREPQVPDERRIRFRIGVNLGDMIVDGDDIFGAARQRYDDRGVGRGSLVTR